MKLRSALAVTAARLRRQHWWRLMAVLGIVTFLMTVAIPVFLLIQTDMWRGVVDAFSPMSPLSITRLVATYWLLLLAFFALILVVHFTVSVIQVRRRAR